MSQSTNTGIVDQITSTVSNAANYVSESLGAKKAEASAEANKEVAKDSNAGVGDRLKAAGNFVSDKAEQHGKETKADAHKEVAKN